MERKSSKRLVEAGYVDFSLDGLAMRHLTELMKLTVAEIG